MRPVNAYIASFSTTGLLLALALVVLVVVGALMAFTGGEDADTSPPVSDVVVDGVNPVTVSVVSERTAARPRAARAAAASTTGVVAAAPLAEAPAVSAPVFTFRDPPPTLELLPGGGQSTADAPAPARDEQPTGGEGVELEGDVDDLVDAIDPGAGETLEAFLEEATGVVPEEGAPPVSEGDQPLAR